MVFQVIIVGGGAVQIDVTFFRQQQLLGAIFIDHVSAVIGCSGCTVCYMHRAEFSSVSGVQVSDGVTISKRNYRWQIKRIILNIANILIQIFRQVAIMVVMIFRGGGGTVLQNRGFVCSYTSEEMLNKDAPLLLLHSGASSLYGAALVYYLKPTTNSLHL